MTVIKTIRDYKKVYKNWVKILYSKKRKQKIINVILRNGNKLSVPSELVYFMKELAIMNFSDGFSFDKDSEVFQFSYEGKKVNMKFYHNGIFNGEFTAFFGDYIFLEPISGSTVIDIGANIGDSAVYFALRGAAKILALEPYKWSYTMLVENVSINNFNENVVTLNSAYGKDGFIELEDTFTDIGTVLKEYNGGIKTPILSLKTILKQYSNELKGELLLKMDCEGCEYNILEENKETIRQFNRIVVEYHNGYERLKNYLDQCGFNVSFTEPHKWYDETTKRHIVQGYIYAKLKGK